MHFLSIIATFKNEALILREWLEYYISQGVDHFYLIDDESDDDYMEVLRHYSSMITIFRSSAPCSRVKNYNKVFEQIREQTNWIIVCDITQYWFPVIGTLRKYLIENDKYDVVTTYGQLFGDANVIFQPNSIIKNFTQICGGLSFKTIAKSKVIDQIQVEQNLLKSGTVVKIDPQNIRLNDYGLLSLEYFMNVKMRRAHPDNCNLTVNWGDFYLQSNYGTDLTLKNKLYPPLSGAA